MIWDKLQEYNIILASESPRRKMLLESLNMAFRTCKTSVKEHFPANYKANEIAVYLAEKKAASIQAALKPKDLLIAADTIVWKDGNVIHKPCSKKEAVEMLHMLSGGRHEVYTGMCLMSRHYKSVFYDKTSVWFKRLTDEEIQWYVTHHNPFDKAGGYGIQEWIGQIGIKRINGSYFNVMGLPLHQLYRHLKKFAEDQT